MIKILKGDDSVHTVDIDLPEATFAPGFRLEFAIGGLTQTFPAARRVSLAFPATWTALQAPGRILGRWSIISPTGQRATLSNTYPVYVTTDASAVGAAGSVAAVIPSVDLSDLQALDASATPGETKELVNEILRRLRSACIALAAAILPLISTAQEVKTAMLDDLPGTAQVVTNVDLSGLAAVSDLNDKRDKTDLAVYAKTNDVSKIRLKAEYLPIWASFDSTKPMTNYTIAVDSLGPGAPPYFLTVSECSGSAMFTADMKLTGTDLYFGPDKERSMYAELEIPTETIAFDTIATMSSVTNAARSVVNTVWDAALGVAWEARMHNGALYYIAVTNRPPEVVQ